MLILYQIAEHLKSQEDGVLPEEKKRSSKRKEQPEQRFDNWAPTYERGLLWRRFFNPLHGQFLEALPEVKGMHVLDVGSGTGALALRLAERGASVTGVDASEGMVEVARSRSEGREEVDFHLAGAEKIPLEDASVDLAVTSIAFHHFEEPRQALREVRRVLKPGAGFYVCDMCGEGLLGRASLRYGRIVGPDYRYFSRQELAEMLTDAGFTVQEVSLIRKIPPVMLIVGLKPEGG